MAAAIRTEPGKWPVVGHEWVVHLLSRAVASGVAETGSRSGPCHAYLFLGPPQVGKTTLSLGFAQALLCTHTTIFPCGLCRSCRLMQKQAHPDFHLVQPVDKEGRIDRLNGTLRVEQAADLVHDVALHPMEGRYKFFLVQEMQRANDSFANKLLKTLEEPPERVVLCLTAVDRSAVLPTIVSRCQVLELRPLDNATLEGALIGHWSANPEQAALLARLAHGRLGWAVAQLDSDQHWRQRKDRLDQLWSLMRASRVDRLAFASQTARNRDDRQLFGLLGLWTAWWRDVMLAQSGCLDDCSNVDCREEIARQAAQLDPNGVRDYLRLLEQVEGYMHHTVNAGLAMDVLLLQLPRPIRRV